MKLKVKYRILDIYKIHNEGCGCMLTTKWWHLPTFSWCTGFRLPNTGSSNDPSRFMGGMYTMSWDSTENGFKHAKLFDKELALNALNYFRNEYIATKNEEEKQDKRKYGYLYYTRTYLLIPTLVLEKEDERT